MSSQLLAKVNPKLLAVNGLGELVEEAVDALRECLVSEDEAVKFAAAKFVMEKLVTPKATHSFMSPETEVIYQQQDLMFCDSVLESCRKGNISVEECQGFLEMKKIHTDISKHQATLDQISRIREMEDRRSKLITVRSGREQLEEAMA
jgi:hypothetical protein